MKSRLIDGVEVQRSSGNVFSVLGLPDADTLTAKTSLVIEVRKAMRNRGLTHQDAAKRKGVTQPKVFDMMRRDFTYRSERKPMDRLTKLGYDIESSVKPVQATVGHLLLTGA